VVLWDRRANTIEAGTDPRWKGVGKGGVVNQVFQ
jgi:hypothetical protein